MQSQTQQSAAWAAAVAARNQKQAVAAAASVGTALSAKPAIGVLNGQNKTFTFSSPPTLVFRNGQCLYSGPGWDYTQSGSTVTFTVAPTPGDIVVGY